MDVSLIWIALYTASAWAGKSERKMQVNKGLYDTKQRLVLSQDKSPFMWLASS